MEIDISTWYVAILSQYKLEVVTIKLEMKGNESLIYGFICQPINSIMDVQQVGFFFSLKIGIFSYKISFEGLKVN